MNNRRNDRGRLNFYKKSYYNSYASSARTEVERRDRSLKVLIIVSILLIAVIAIMFFTNSGSFIPAFIQQTTNRNQSGNNPNTDIHPYATVPTRENYLAEGNGKGLGSLALASDYAVLVDLSSMDVIASKQADTTIYPASMTKIMTVLVACDLISDLDDTYVITRSVLNQVPRGASTAWFSDYVGETVTVKDILFGVTYRSGADAVLCLLDYLNTPLDDFVALMNEKAASLGLKNTHFGGVIGMDDENNQTTCREMAAIMAYAMDNPLCRQLFGGQKHSLTYISELSYYHGTLNTTVVQVMGESPNSLVKGYTVLAAKSGFETKAQHCLASYIQNNETGECFVLVTAYAEGDKTKPINDLSAIIKVFKP